MISGSLPHFLEETLASYIMRKTLSQGLVVTDCTKGWSDREPEWAREPGGKWGAHVLHPLRIRVGILFWLWNLPDAFVYSTVSAM